jgi:N-acetylneuraminate synthase
MHIAGLDVGAGHPCRIVAEISNNHNGDLDRALRLINAAAEAGADIVKTQAYTPAELVALRGDGPAPGVWGEQGWTMRTLYEKAQTPLAWIPTIAAECRRIGIPWFSSVFGPESLRVLESCECPTYKVASLDRKSEALRSMLRGHTVVLSTPAPLWNAVWVVADIAVLYCPPGYPTLVSDVHLPRRFNPLNGYDGLSSHCLAPELSVAAVARGAKVLEYHVMLTEEPSELESGISLTDRQFADMVQSVRRTEVMLA